MRPTFGPQHRKEAAQPVGKGGVKGCSKVHCLLLKRLGARSFCLPIRNREESQKASCGTVSC